jgi:hypothetical protein
MIWQKTRRRPRAGRGEYNPAEPGGGALSPVGARRREIRRDGTRRPRAVPFAPDLPPPAPRVCSSRASAGGGCGRSGGMADAGDLKSSGPCGPCGFDPRLRQSTPSGRSAHGGRGWIRDDGTCAVAAARSQQRRTATAVRSSTIGAPCANASSASKAASTTSRAPSLRTLCANRFNRARPNSSRRAFCCSTKPSV